MTKIRLKPSPSIKWLFTDNFSTKLLSKLLSDLYIGVYSKGTKKFGSKVINRQYFHRRLKSEGYVSNDRLENESYAATKERWI